MLQLAIDERTGQGDLVEGASELGSLLWTLPQHGRSQKTLALAEDYAKAALAWMVDDGVAAEIDAAARFEGEVLVLKISIRRTEDSKWQSIWEGQANGL